MKRAITICSVVAVLLATISLATVADNKTMTWTGWISDSHCGAKGMSADHAACAKTCVKNGSTWVFVNGADKKVIPIHNQDAINGDRDLGGQVTVKGHLMDDGSLHVDTIDKNKT
jgi:hypothetical protein